jgi:hypothetical protein
VALAAYESLTRFFLHDPSAQAYSTSSVDTAINAARRHVATQGECVRVLLSGGVVTSLVVNSVGSGITNGTWPLVFGGVGQQTFGTATVSGGAVAGVVLTRGGWGWVAGPPTVSLPAAAGGSGFICTATVDNSASTVPNQEFVNFSTLNQLAVLTPGVLKVIGINAIACQWGAGSVYKPTLQKRTWSWFQAHARVYSTSALNFPSYWSKYTQGDVGNFYLFPIPSQVMSMDIDAICLPIDLVDDTTIEAVPNTFTDAVAYYAAHLCYLNSSRATDAERMLQGFRRELAMARKAMEGSAFVPNQYVGM